MIGAAALGTPSPRTAKQLRVQAPMQGVDTRVSVGEGSPLNSVYQYNMVPFEFGCQLRYGYQEHQIGLEDNIGLGVHSIIPFDGVDSQGAGDKLFAVTNEGIWDVTVKGAAPIFKIMFTDQSAEAGYGPYAHYVTDAGEGLLYYADSLNGLMVYDPLLDTWVQDTSITGPVVENINFIVVHKQRIWLIEEESTKAWYLPIGSRSGQATEFFFGSKFKHGGSLEGLYNWSVDGGDGVDDLLVAVSHSGDILPFKGADPSSADTWQIVGTYFIGEVPEGPFFATQEGGELFILSAFGLISLNDMLQGVDSDVLQSNEEGVSRAYKIAGILRTRLADTLGLQGWTLGNIPSEGGFLISSPTVGSDAPIQYYYNLSTQAWGFWRGVPMTAFESWRNTVMFGTADGRIMSMDVEQDEVLLTPPVDGPNGREIEFSLLTSFNDYDEPAAYKLVTLIRPDFLAVAPPVYTVKANYDFDLQEALIHTGTAGIGVEGGLWDVSQWDMAVWGSEVQHAFNDLDGNWGYGRYVAVALKGKATRRTRLVGFDLLYKTGGFLL